MDNIELKKQSIVAQKISNHIHWDNIDDNLQLKGKYVAELIFDIFNEYIKNPKENKLLIKLVPFDDFPKYENKGPSLYSKEHFLMHMDSQKLIKKLKLNILKKFGNDSPISTSYEYQCAEFTLTDKTLNYLKETLDEIKKELVPIFSFDNEKSILKVGNKTIEIRYKSNQYHILNTIFEDIKKEWFFSEIGEKIDFAKQTKNPDKYWHNHTTAIKTKIFNETGINDLIKTTTHSVRINPIYLV